MNAPDSPKHPYSLVSSTRLDSTNPAIGKNHDAGSTPGNPQQNTSESGYRLRIRRNNPDYSLYLVTDSGMTGRDRLVDTVARAVKGGVTVVQYRDKEASTAQMIREATQIRDVLDRHDIPLIVNDRVDVALAVGAHGVHVGQNDMEPDTVRKLMGPKAIIGYSVETWQQARQVEQLDIDYLGVSPIFATPTKTDTGRPWGVEGLQQLRKLTRKPLVAIGGMNKDTLEDALGAGSDGIAVVSAICASPDPEQSARELAELIKKARPAR